LEGIKVDYLTSESKILASLKLSLPYFPVLFNEDIAMGIADKEKYLVVRQGKELILNLKEGDIVPEGGAVSEALKTGKTIIKDVPKKVYGVPFQSFAIPVHEGENVVGVFVVGKSLSRKTEIQIAIRNLSGALQQISGAVNDISSGVQEVAIKNTDLMDKANESCKKTKGTNEILDFIQNISSQTNLLGLNASIEAARVGEVGRGFNIVAQEIRKLSSSTNESVKKINNLLTDITTSNKMISENISETNYVFQSQVAALEELNASSQVLERMSELL
jgi:uncharacterized protein YoxC